MSIILLVVGILLFIGLIVVHEFGHFIVARRNGVKVEEFGIFFPPRLFKRKMKAGWLFTINLLPLGGFVRLKGEHDSDTEPGTFGAATLWVKTKIMAAGVLLNLVTALVMFTLIALVGMPEIVDNQFTVKSDTKPVSRQVLITYIEPGSPADKAGLKTQDQLNDIALPGRSPVPIESAANLPKVTKNFAGQTATIFYTRSGHHQEAKVTLRTAAEVEASRKTDVPKGYIGVIPTDFSLQRSTWSAPVVAVGLSTQLTALTFQGLGHALAGLGSTIAGISTGNTEARQNGQTKASEQVSGPVGIFVILKDGSLIGYQFMLFIVAYISLTLAIMNILPIPALDGGRLWLTLASRGILKRPLTARQEEMINAGGFMVLIGLIILITVVDVKRFF
ncbi:MAG TPA: M50 family metallopeptidase [Candidatus Saccharimonadales bacterium]|nr:M50 family metallopeptidase [Candidatus Saccharimonadales bacterium]